LLAASYLVAGCSGADRAATEGLTDEAPAANGRLFTQLPSGYTGVRFENRLVDTRELNVFTYRNYYNGGGVALGDLTGDGLPELLLTSNLDANRLRRPASPGRGPGRRASPSPTSTGTDSSTSTSATRET
jgi:hypothetical protein